MSAAFRGRVASASSSRARVRPALLSLLRESPKHGCLLMKELQDVSGGLYTASRSNTSEWSRLEGWADVTVEPDVAGIPRVQENTPNGGRPESPLPLRIA